MESTIEGSARVQIFLGGFALLVLLVMAVLPYLDDSILFTVAADIAKLFLTVYLAYLITQHFARQSARQELRDVGETSGRHLFLLSSHIRELADEVLSYEPDGDRSALHYQLMAAEMNRLASQAELSFQDMQQIAKLDISVPALLDEARTRVTEATRREVIQCPKCDAERDVHLDLKAGSTKAVRCDKCSSFFNVHRLPDESVRFSFEDRYVLDCPNPECGNEMTLKRSQHEYGITVRNCYECFARIRFDLDHQEVESFTIEEPLGLEREAIVDGQGKCAYCSWLVSFTETRNSRGEWVQYCPNCTKLIRVEEEPLSSG